MWNYVLFPLCFQEIHLHTSFYMNKSINNSDYIGNYICLSVTMNEHMQMMLLVSNCPMSIQTKRAMNSPPYNTIEPDLYSKRYWNEIKCYVCATFLFSRRAQAMCSCCLNDVRRFLSQTNQSIGCESRSQSQRLS